MKHDAQLALFALSLLSLTALPAFAGDAQPPGTPTASTAESLISQLGSDDFKIRTAASRQLNNLPGDALPVVQAAIDSGLFTGESQLRLETAARYLKPRSFFENRRRENDEYERRLLHEAYHQCGQTDPKYDKAADDAIDSFRTLLYEPRIQVAEPERKKAVAGFKLATDDGCDDPLIQCLYCASAGSNSISRLPMPLNSPRAIYPKLLEGKYHPAVKLLVIYRLFPCIGPDKQKLKTELPGVLDALCAEKQVPQTEVYALLSQLATAYSLFSVGGEYTFDPLLTEYKKLRPNQTD